MTCSVDKGIIVDITINSQQLAEELRLLCKIVPSKPTLQILGHVLLEADMPGLAGQGTLHLYATDLEIGIASECPIVVDQPGAVALPATKLMSLVEQFPNADVRITAEEGKVLIKCGQFKTFLQVLPVEMMPRQATINGVANVIDAASLRQLIAKTRHAIITTGNKYVLQGSFLTFSGPAAAMVATDGKRLAMATVRREGTDAQVIIPAKTLDILSSQGDNGPLDFSIGDKHLFFKVGKRLIISRMLEGEFPKYDRIIPRDNNTRIEIDRAGLAAALRRINLVAGDNDAVYFDFTSNLLTLSSSSADIGSADETLAVSYEGAPLKVCINGEYVLDFLDGAIGQVITLALKDPNGSALLIDGVEYLVVISLMRF